MAHSIPGSFFISSRPVTSSPTERVYPLTYLCDLPPLPRYLETLSRAQGEPWSLHLSLTLGVAYPPAIFPVSLFFLFSFFSASHYFLFPLIHTIFVSTLLLPRLSLLVTGHSPPDTLLCIDTAQTTPFCSSLSLFPPAPLYTHNPFWA